MRVILCGYHWTGCKALELLLEEGHDVFVYTHETENCVADLEGLCIRKGVPYSLNKITSDNLPFIPDMICSIYYRWIIKKDVIEIVKGRIFNLHPALLPKYRGCSSLTWAMINGEKECGFTYHYIDEGCDTGNIIIQKSIKIEDFDTQLTLYNRVMFESMNCFLEAVNMVAAGFVGIRQSGIATEYRRGCPLEGKIDDSMNDEMKERFVRAMCYPPYPAAQYNNQEIRTFRDLQEKMPRGGKAVLFGCGGHARSIVNTLLEFINDLSVLLVDENADQNEFILNCKVVNQYELGKSDFYIVAVGDNNKREKIYQFLTNKYERQCLSVISKYAVLGLNVMIGRGTFIAANVYIGPQVDIGNNTIINTGSVVEHEVKIGNNTHIAPNTTICGRTVIGNNVLVGAGSVVVDKLTICDDVVIGAGSVVRKDIFEPGVYVGVPAKRIK